MDDENRTHVRSWAHSDGVHRLDQGSRFPSADDFPFHTPRRAVNAEIAARTVLADRLP